MKTLKRLKCPQCKQCLYEYPPYLPDKCELCGEELNPAKMTSVKIYRCKRCGHSSTDKADVKIHEKACKIRIPLLTRLECWVKEQEIKQEKLNRLQERDRNLFT